MADTLKGVQTAPYHFILFVVLAWRLYYYLPPISFVVAISALLWLVIRLDHVLRQPVDQLVGTLGLEVPVAPVLSLLDITTDSISIHWKVPEKKADIRYAVLVNGISVGDVLSHDPSLSVTGLSAGFCYAIRVVAINSQNFQAASDPVRAQTSRIRYSVGRNEGQSGTHTPPGIPAIVPYKGPHGALVVPVSLPLTPSEHSSPRTAQLEHRYSSDHEAVSHPAFREERAEHLADPHQRVHALTGRLNELRRESEELHKQDEEDEAQFQEERDALLERRDKLRQELRDREDGSKELKKSIAQLERQNTATQQKKANMEKALESKQQERRKLREDVERWDREVLEMDNDMQAMAAEREMINNDNQERAVSAREEREPDLQAIKQLEEQIRDVGKQIKDLEENKTASNEPSVSPVNGHADAQPLEDIKVFNERIDGLKRTMQRTWSECTRSQQYLQQLQVRHGTLQSQARVAPGVSDESYQAMDTANLQSSPMGHGKAFLGRHVVPGAYYGHLSNTNAYNSNTGYAIQQQHDPEATVDPTPDKFSRELPSQVDIDRLTGGAMFSPAANALIPSDLLGEEADAPSRRHVSRYSQPGSEGRASNSPSITPEPGNGEPAFLPGLGNMPRYGSSGAMHQHHHHSSPQNDSRSPSMTSSPHDSVSAFHQHRLSEPTADSDSRSLRSNSGSIRGQTGRSRLLGDMFSRQRGKTTPDDGPSLGSLKSYQSRSMPRHYDQDSTTADIGSPEQRRNTPGGLLDSMSNAVLGRRMMHSSRLASRNDATSVNDATARHDAFSRPSSGVNPWSTTSLEHNSHSRASSVYSAENMLPRPSSESQPFGWKESGISRSNTTSSARHRMSPWSAYGSRRGSAQVEPTGSGTISRLDEDELPLESDAEALPQAPIGTKPSRFSMKKAPRPRDTSPSGQLNPNARDFKSMFTRDRKIDKTNAKVKSKSKNASDVEASTPPVGEGLFLEWKRSHEYNSQSASESVEDVTGSVGSNTNDGTPTNRESLMKKLSRKSSQLPGLKGKKSTAPSTPVIGVDDSDDEGSSVTQPILARTPSSLTISPKVSHEKEKDKDAHGKRTSGFSLSSFKRRSRRDGKDAPSISEASVASETGDDTASHDRSERASVDG